MSFRLKGCLCFSSLGERYGLRIIPGVSSCLVLPNDISWSSVVGAISNPGGPARSLVSMSRVFSTGLGMSGMGKGIGGERVLEGKQGVLCLVGMILILCWL
jgi:hypothetical protein